MMDGFEVQPRRMPVPARPWPERILMLVTDCGKCGNRSLPQVVAAAVAGGVNVVQLREKDLPPDELLALARQLRGICGTEAAFFVNDRLDVALLCGADGVQLGEHGLPVAATRALLPASMRVGRSIHSVGAAREAEQEGADFLIAGTMFPTSSHPGARVAGPELLRSLVSRIELPVIAIGGIDARRAVECVEAGADGVAVISGILSAACPETAAREYALALGL